MGGANGGAKGRKTFGFTDSTHRHHYRLTRRIRLVSCVVGSRSCFLPRTAFSRTPPTPNTHTQHTPSVAPGTWRNFLLRGVRQVCDSSPGDGRRLIRQRRRQARRRLPVAREAAPAPRGTPRVHGRDHKGPRRPRHAGWDLRGVPAVGKARLRRTLITVKSRGSFAKEKD